MRRRVRIALATATGFAIAISGAACGTTSENSGGAAGGKQFECKGAKGGPYTIGMSQANVAEPYRKRMDDDIAAAAKQVKEFGPVKFTDAAQKTDKQADDIRNFVTQQIDLLIVSPNQASLGATVKQAKAKGIPVIVLDRKLDDPDAYTTFIGADNTSIGKQAGEYISSKLLPNGGKVVELKGLSGSTPANERHNGFEEAIKGKKIDVVASEDGEWLRDKGQEKMDAILKANPDIDVVYSQNDPMAEGAYLAAKSAGREKKIKFTGIDGLPIPSGGIKAVEAGRLSATFVYPTGGAEAIAAAKKILVDCQDAPKQQTLPTQEVTKDNAAEVYAKANEGSN